jgi:acyl carrier protein
MEEMKEKIRRYIISEYLEDGDAELDYDTPIIASGIVDSMSMMSLITFLEATYKISIPDEKVSPERFYSINKIVELVNEMTKN